MFDKFLQFWRTFWKSLKTAYNAAFKSPPISNAQDWRDFHGFNLLAVFVGKLNNLTNTEATFTVQSDSTQAASLEMLCADLEAHRFEVTASMLADGDFFAFPATNGRGEIVHSYLTQDRVRITALDGEQITEAYAILDWKQTTDGKYHYLLRRHSLDNNGNLTVEYSVLGADGKSAPITEWEALDGKATVYNGANHIGFGRYKCPADSRGTSLVYGVPLNYGCADLEQAIEDDMRLINDEFKNGKSVIFTDPRNLLTDREKGGYKIAENIIPITSRAGANGANIDIFNPNLRWSEHYSKLVSDMARLEAAIGTSKGILTDNETSYTATATAVRRANSDTLALIDRIRAAIDAGNEMTLAADAVFLNVRRDLWAYSSDWYDPFEDPSEQWDRLKEAQEVGAVEVADLTKWLFPRLDDDEIEAKLGNISTARNMAQSDALDRILNGR